MCAHTHTCAHTRAHTRTHVHTHTRTHKLNAKATYKQNLSKHRRDPSKGKNQKTVIYRQKTVSLKQTNKQTQTEYYEVKRKSQKIPLSLLCVGRLVPGMGPVLKCGLNL